MPRRRNYLSASSAMRQTAAGATAAATTSALAMLAVLTMTAPWGCIAASPPSRSPYEQLCGAIVQHAQAAARSHNAGDTAAAQEHSARAANAYEKAAALDPMDPQAHANMAVFTLNSQRWEESLRFWQLALDRMDGNPVMQSMVKDRMRFARLRAIGTKRNEAYNDGQGNITLALSLAEQELALMRTPEILADLGVMLTMLAEDGDGAASLALFRQATNRYAEAQNVAYNGWVIGQRQQGRCTGDGASLPGVLRRWQEAPGVKLLQVSRVEGGRTAKLPREGRDETENDNEYGQQNFIAHADGMEVVLNLAYKEGRVFVAQLADAALSGNDGIICQPDLCRVFTGATGAYVDLAANMQLFASWDTRGPQGQYQWHDHFTRQSRPRVPPIPKAKSVKRVASVIQFAVRSYYHWVMEALGRLLLLEPHLAADPSLKVLLPASGKKTGGFIAQFLALLPFPLDASRVVWYNARNGPNSERARVAELLFPDWDSVEHVGAAEDPVHCLAPRSVLRRIRRAFARPAAAGASGGGGEDVAPPLLVFVTRKSQKMRRLVDEGVLLEMLRRDAAASTTTAYEIRVFNGDNTTIAESIALFSRAAAVVGVHGGALANIVFCREGTAVIELGFRSPATRHYAHAAMALRLPYSLHFVQPVPQGVAASLVTLGSATLQAVVDGVRQAMASGGSGGSGKEGAGAAAATAATAETEAAAGTREEL